MMELRPNDNDNYPSTNHSRSVHPMTFVSVAIDMMKPVIEASIMSLNVKTIGTQNICQIKRFDVPITGRLLHKVKNLKQNAEKLSE